jgi:nucleotide-binding universal stress UspA family protein
MNDKPIVVGYDGSPGAEAALRWSLEEGRRTGAPIRLVRVFDWPLHVTPIAPGVGVFPDTELRRDTAAALAVTVEKARVDYSDVVVTGGLVDGPTVQALLEQSRQASLVVLGSRGLGGFTGLLLGSVGVAVSAHAHSPVVVVRGTDRPAGSGAPVVVGVDGSSDSLLAAAYAFEQASARGVGVEAIRAWTPPAPPWRSTIRPLALDADELETAERHLLDAALAGLRTAHPAVPTRTRVVASGAAQALVESSRTAQLVVVGSRGLGGFRGLLLGSVSQQLLHHADCPVAVIRRDSVSEGERTA